MYKHTFYTYIIAQLNIKINSKTGKVKAQKAGTANITVKAGNLIRKVKVKVVK